MARMARLRLLLLCIANFLYSQTQMIGRFKSNRSTNCMFTNVVARSNSWTHNSLHALGSGRWRQSSFKSDSGIPAIYWSIEFSWSNFLFLREAFSEDFRGNARALSEFPFWKLQLSSATSTNISNLSISASSFPGDMSYNNYKWLTHGLQRKWINLIGSAERLVLLVVWPFKLNAPLSTFCTFDFWTR